MMKMQALRQYGQSQVFLRLDCLLLIKRDHMSLDSLRHLTGIKPRYDHLPTIVALDQANEELEQHLIKYSEDMDESRKEKALKKIYYFLLD